MTDLDQSGHGFQRVRTYLGPTLGWKDELVKPSVDITTSGTYVVQPGDSVLLVDVAGSVEIQLPDVKKWVNQSFDRPATAFEKSITVKDQGGNAANFNILVAPFGQDAIDDVQQSVLIQTARGTLKLLPLIDLTGWTVETTGGSGTTPVGGGDVFKAGNNTYTGINIFTNTTIAPTQATGDNSNKVATTEYVKSNLTNYQSQDDDLGAIAGFTGTNSMIYRVGSGNWQQVVIGANLTFTGGTLAATGGGSGGAPTTAEYITSTPDATLTAERVLTDSASITWDRTVAGEIKANSSAGGGNVSAVPTPAIDQIAVWTTGVTIKGVDKSTLGFQPLDGDLTALSGLLGTNTIYYRSAPDIWSPVTYSGLVFSGGVLTVTSAGGNVSNVGTPTVDQVAIWTDATHIKGVTPATLNVVLYNYIGGVNLSNGAGDAVNDITVQPGQAADSTNTQMISLPAQITKQLDVLWAVGDNQGGRDGGTIGGAATYHVYLIWGPGPVVDVTFSASTAAPALPSGYTKFRRVGSIIWSGTTILPFRQSNSYFTHASLPILDVNVTNLSTTRQLYTLTVPTGISPIARFRMDTVHASGGGVVVTDPTEPDAAVVFSTTGFTARAMVSGSSSEFQVRTDQNAQVAARSNVTATTLRINTLGWIDSRGSGTQESGSPVLAQNGFSANKGGTNQTIPTGTATKVTFQNTVYDVGGYYDVANNRYRPPPGLVHFDANVDYSAGLTSGNAIFVHLYKNAAPYVVQRIVTSAVSGAAQLSVDDKADGNDYYEIWTTCTAGTNGTVDGTSTGRTFFTAHIPGGQAGPPGPVGAAGPTGAPGTNGGEWSTGDVKMTYKTVADTNWLMMNDQFIGSAASGAATADNAVMALFTLLFNNIADSQCPIQQFNGAATTRAAQGNAATAWSNNCRIQLPRILGRALSGTGSGTGAGLSNRVLASNIGAQTVTLDGSTLAAHTHLTGAVGVSVTSSDVSVMNGPGPALNTSSAGSSTAFSLFQPAHFLNVMIRL